MAAKAKASSQNPAPSPKANAKAASLAKPPLKPPLTLEEHLYHIEAMGKRIDGYIQYMCQIAQQAGTSAEAKERAVITFYEKMLIVERQLGRVHDELRLE